MSLETDIDALREHAGDTQALYREVCALLFFRYGETPTANRLYQLVRKGSMSAPAKALRDFWLEVREKTRVDVGQPDLPPELAVAAGELAATLWRQSNDAANGALDVFRREAQAQVEAAQDDVRRAQDACASAERAATLAEANAAADRQRLAELEARLVEQQTANAMLREQLGEAKEETSAATGALAEARRDFAAELEKLRLALTQNEQRLAASEKRALLEIDSERAAASRARKELQVASERLSELDTAYRAERDGLRDSLASLKTQLSASASRCANLEEQLSAKESLLASQIAMEEALRERLETVSARLDAGRATTAPPRSTRRLPLLTARRTRQGMDSTFLAFGKRNNRGT